MRPWTCLTCDSLVEAASRIHVYYEHWSTRQIPRPLPALQRFRMASIWFGMYCGSSCIIAHHISARLRITYGYGMCLMPLQKGGRGKGCLLSALSQVTTVVLYLKYVSFHLISLCSNLKLLSNRRSLSIHGNCKQRATVAGPEHQNRPCP